VTLLAHVLDSPNADNDVLAVHAFAKSVGADALVPSGLDEVRSIAASANVVIGSRMHACLNALSVGTPAIPLAYSRKFDSLLSDLGWTHTVDLRAPGDPVAAVLAILTRDLAADVKTVSATAAGSLDAARMSLAAFGPSDANMTAAP
jgi:polysaccharide pyruvyl transferase WcaK-like protein